MSRPPDHSALSSLQTVMRQVDQFNRLATRQHLDILGQLQAAMAPLRRQHLDMMRNIGSLGQFESIARANERLISAFDSNPSLLRQLKAASAAHRSWTLAHNVTEFIQTLSQAQIASTAQFLTLTEKLLASVDPLALRLTLPVQSMVTAHRQSISNLCLSMNGLTDSLAELPHLVTLPSFVLPAASREVFCAALSLKQLEPDCKGISVLDIPGATLVTEENLTCEQLLERLDPKLVSPFKGAKAALEGSRPDRSRHVLTSLRELCTHVLHRVAPDDDVLTWIPDSSPEMLYDGKPTRRARLAFLCRGFNHGQLVDFVSSDMKAFIELFQVLNRLHVLDPELTEHQLRALVLRTESWLFFVLTTWHAAGAD